MLAEHGLNMTRSFFYWPDFHPTPDSLDEQCVANFADFLDAHSEIGMTTVPTFLVGHMSGENWDPAWRDGRDLYSDVWFVGRQAWYVRELTSRFAAHPAVAGWLLTNEVPIYGGEAPRPIVDAWASLLVNAVRAGGGTQPVAVGDGAWGIETTGHDNGFSVRDLAEFTDFIGPHVYRMETDQIRQHLKAAYIAELSATHGLPGDHGGVRADQRLRVGCGRRLLLPAAAVLDAAGRRDRLDRVEQHRLRRPRRPAAVLAPSVRDALRHHRPARRAEAAAARAGAVRVRSGRDRPRRRCGGRRWMRRSSCRRTSPRTTRSPTRTSAPTSWRRGSRRTSRRTRRTSPSRWCVRSEDGGLPTGYGLYLLPSVKQLCATSWQQLVQLARGGCDRLRVVLARAERRAARARGGRTPRSCSGCGWTARTVWPSR